MYVSIFVKRLTYGSLLVLAILFGWFLRGADLAQSRVVTQKVAPTNTPIAPMGTPISSSIGNAQTSAAQPDNDTVVRHAAVQYQLTGGSSSPKSATVWRGR